MTLTPANLKAFLDANPARYKSGPDLQPDGYLTTGHIENLLVGQQLIANPQPQGTIPKPWTAMQLLGVVSAATQGNLAGHNLIAEVQVCAMSQDAAGILALAQLAVNVGAMTPAEQTAVQAIVTATQPDPAWPAQVQGPSDLQNNFGVASLPPANITYTNGKLVSYVTFVDQTLSRPGTVVS